MNRLKIITYPADFTLKYYNDMMKDGKLQMLDFTGHYNWSVEKASKFVESFLLGLPLSNIILYKDIELGETFIVDGKERIHSIVAFLSGTLRLCGVHETWNNKKFDDLSVEDQEKLNTLILRAIIILNYNHNKNINDLKPFFERYIDKIK